MNTLIETIKDSVRKKLTTQNLSGALLHLDELMHTHRITTTQHKELQDWVLTIKDKKFEFLMSVGGIRKYKCFGCGHVINIPQYQLMVKCMYCGHC